MVINISIIFLKSEIFLKKGDVGMVSPRRYREQLENLEIDGFEIDVSSIRNAMEVLNSLDEYEKILRQIRYNVRGDVRNIRMDYLNKLQEMENSNKKGLFGREKSKEKILKEKKALKKDRDLEIAAYDIVETMIDNYLGQIEDARNYIRHTIEKKVG
jgi:ribosome recycling factor